LLDLNPGWGWSKSNRQPMGSPLSQVT